MQQSRLNKSISPQMDPIIGLKHLVRPLEIFFLVAIICKLYNYHHLLGGVTDRSVLALSSLGGILLISFWVFLLRGRFKYAALILLDAFLSVLIFSDTLFYRYFGDVISVNLILSQISVVGSVQSSILSLIHGSDVLFFFDFILLIPILFYLKKKKKSEMKLPYWHSIVKSGLLLAFGILLFSYGYKSVQSRQPDILVMFYDRTAIVQKLGLFNVHAIDVYKYFFGRNRSSKDLAKEELQAVSQFVKEKQSRPLTEPMLFGAGKGKNLIVIQVEALQGFVINAAINGREITPNMNKLVKDSLYFDNYYCETAGGGTSDAEFLANVSLFPAKEGAAYIRFAGNTYDSLAKRMEGAGYGSIVMHAFKPGFWNRSVMYKTLGFDEYFNKNNLEQDEIIGMGLSDKSFYRQSLVKLHSLKQPYYAFLISLSSHYPYTNDEEHYSPFDVAPYEDSFFGNYLKAIHYADEALGTFIEALKKEGDWDNSVLALYGDHFAISRDKNEEMAKFLNVYMSDFNWVRLQKVPMLIHFPGDQNAGTNSKVGGGVDFMPTVLNIMGIQAEDAPMLGQDLLNSKSGLAIMRSGNFITDDYMRLSALDLAFDLKTSKAYDPAKLAETEALVKKSLDASDKIIEHDLIDNLKDDMKEK